jgi:hypothetical protein
MGGKDRLGRHAKELEEFISAKKLTPLSPPTTPCIIRRGRSTSFVATK